MSNLGNEFHPVVLSADSTDLQANSLVRIAEAFTAGLPAAGISGVLSIYNTFADYVGAEQVETEDAVRRFAGDEIGDWYQENKSAADIVGFLMTAVPVGSVGLVGVKLLRGGQALGAFGRSLGYTQSRSHYWLKQAMKETAESGGTIRGILSSPARKKQFAWEVADKALLTTAAELTIVGTMMNSPIFDDNTASDFAWNIAIGTMFGGVLGGTFNSVAAKGLLKDVSRQVQSEMRLVDTVTDYKRMGITKGTELAAYLDSILTRPDGMQRLGYKFLYNQKWQHIPGGFDISGPIAKARESATKLANQELALKFNELAQNNATIGQAYSRFVMNGIDAARQAGKSPDEIVELLHGYLENVSKIGPLDLDRMALDARKFYINLKPTGTSPLERLVSSFSKTRTATTTKQAYLLADDVVADDLTIVKMEDIGAPTLHAAFKARPDADVLQLANGSFRFNPKSTKVRRFKETPHTVNMILDLRTGDLAPETVPTFGDIIQAGKVTNTIDYIAGGGRSFAMAGSVASAIDRAPVEGSARWAWASGRSITELFKVTGGKVNADDLPVLQRLAEFEKADAASVNKFTVIGEELGVTSYHKYAQERRLKLLHESMSKLDPTVPGVKVPDARVVAANLGVTVDWVEDVIMSGYKLPATDEGILETAAALLPKSIAVEWNFGVVAKMLPEAAYKMNMGPSHLATQALTRHYQIAIYDQIADNAVKASLGDDADLIVNIEKFMPSADGRSAAQTTNLEGAGANAVGAANASYGERAKLAAQESGKNVALLTQRLRDGVVETLSPEIARLRANKAAAGELAIVTTALRKSEYRYVIDPTNPNRLLSQEVRALMIKESISAEDALKLIGPSKSPHSFTFIHKEAADFIRLHTKINADRQDKMLPLWTASGMVRQLPDEPVVYVPPIDTVRYPYHAIVRTKAKVGLATDTGMITAKSEEQLRELVAKVSDDYDVFYSKDTANYFKAKGEYDYQMTLNEARVNSDLARRGVLADLMPETRLENIMEDYLHFHAKQEEKHVRMAVQVLNRRFFNEVGFLSDQYRTVSESVMRGIGSRFKAKVADPFGDVIKTALNISKQQEFPLLDSLNEFVDKIGIKMGQAMEAARRDAASGMITYTEANKIMEAHGLKFRYLDEATYITANERYPRNLVREAFQKVNLWLATTVLRLDFANSIVNMISTPILLGTELASIKQLIKQGDPLAGKLHELMSLKVPGKDIRIPATTHLIGNALTNYLGKDSAKLIKRYRDIGAIKDVSQLFHEILDDISFRPNITPRAWVDKLNNAVEKGATITGNNMSEELTRFVAADVMRQITDVLVDAKRLTIQEQNAYIGTFVNRVQGNYVTSQRPILFQGTTGAAISLFQTYAFNVLQQLYRHMQAGHNRTLLVFAGLQSSIYGLNGLPFFDAVNTHLIGRYIADDHTMRDAYSVLPAFNQELGNWMLYGTASAMPLFTGSFPALFTRGDINPRHLTIVPIHPLDVPAVNASLKLIDTIYNTGRNLVAGADTSNALLQGLQHQGWNRPLAGAAQLLAGHSVTSKGSLISAANDIQATSWLGALAERTVEYGGVARLMGARPMDEAIALDVFYRQQTYRTLDRARISRLGQVVKSKLYAGEVPTEEEFNDFLLRYARSGGRIDTFQQAMQRWNRDANVSIVNQLANRLQSPYGQTLQSIMGGERITDYRSDPLAGDTLLE